MPGRRGGVGGSMRGRSGPGIRVVLPLALVAASLWFNTPAHAQSGAIIRYSMEPRVVDTAAPAPVTITLVGDSNVTSADFRFRNATVVPMTSTGPSTFQITLTAEQAISGYRTGEIQNYIGSVRTYASGTQTDSDGVELNIKDETMASVPITPVGTDAQRSPHVANLRYDTPFTGEGSPDAVLQRFYERFPDTFDFAAIVAAHQNEVFFAGRFQGPGSSSGSSMLDGVLIYPGDGGFDLGAYLALHELSHNWMNFSDYPPLTTNGGHWPASDLLQGVLGRGNGYFPFDLVPEGGNYRLVRGGRTGFNDLELYKMGLIPPEQVGTHFVFNNQSQPTAAEGVLWTGPVTTFGVSDIIASDGPQNPPFSTSKKDFRIASIVLSEGRLLTPTEMAYFDHVAARAAARKPFTVRTSSTDPWYPATGGRATLDPAFGPVPAPTVTSVVAGAPGKAIVNGTALIAAREIRFGGTVVEFTVDSNSRLTASVPAGVADSTVTVVTPTGTAQGTWGGGGTQPSPSPSPSVSASPSVGPSPSASPSTSPDPAITPSPSPSPSPSPTEVSHPRTLRFALKLPTATRLIGKGVLKTPDGFDGCSRHIRVWIERRKRDGGWRIWTEAETTNTGTFRASLKPGTGKIYRARVDKEDFERGHICLGAKSRPVRS